MVYLKEIRVEGDIPPENTWHWEHGDDYAFVQVPEVDELIKAARIVTFAEKMARRGKDVSLEWDEFMDDLIRAVERVDK